MATTTDGPVAVIDIGSNSARVVVYGQEASGHLRILASSRAGLRLVREVDSQRRLSEEAMARTMEALRDFRAIALGAGAQRILAVATAAMRDAGNGELVIERIRRELGIEVRMIDGDREAHYGFVGAVRGLPVTDGLVFDMGGGSMQVSRFRGRELDHDWSLPLGALRLTQAFLEDDPPRAGEIRRLRSHVRQLLEGAGIPRLKAGQTLVGTGGTVRNLAKIDRRSRGYPITRLHGYVLTRRHAHDVVARVVATPMRKRDRIPGLSDERADSIGGGALAIETLMESVEAAEILVSGQGVREGIAYSLLAGSLPPPGDVRRESMDALTGRFSAWEAEMADRREALALRLHRCLEGDGQPETAEALAHAARILDVGRSVDYFDRYEHAATIVLASELDGFSHREIALVAAVIRTARDPDADARALHPILKADDLPAVARAGVILALADDIGERCPRGRPIALDCRSGAKETVITVPELAGWRPRMLGARFQDSFGRALVVRHGEG